MKIHATTVRLLRRRPARAANTAGMMLLAVLLGTTLCDALFAQGPHRHWLHAGQMPPGAIGSQRLLSGGPLSPPFPSPKRCVQPVEIIAPGGVTISALSGGGFTTPQADSLLVGLLIGPVYRFQVTGVPDYEQIEVYPTVEVIDRLYPPPGKELKFPIPVQLTAEELRMAAAGSFVTRVIYVEDPNNALPIAEARVEGRPEQNWFEARPDQDPLVVADTLGRPVAILRIGSRLPGSATYSGRAYSDPPLQLYGQGHVETTPYAAPVQQTGPAHQAGLTQESAGEVTQSY